MGVAVVTGSGGLIGSEAVRFLVDQGFDVIGFDNDTRASLFGPAASTRQAWTQLERQFGRYAHVEADIREAGAVDQVFCRLGSEIKLIVHAAAQPSHDWAVVDPRRDFAINAGATLNLLEAARAHSPGAVFIFCSTNKVYGDTPNRLPFVEQDRRWELPAAHEHFAGLDETMSIDASVHSLFGVSKCAADLMVQEYGHYFGMNTACFRCGCITGGAHAGASQHGFLSYLVRCAVGNRPYTIVGYKGKQVRDNLHAFDLVSAFWHFFAAPYPAALFNMGGGREVNCSVNEAIARVETITGRPMIRDYQPVNRVGDHIWWISDTRRFRQSYPDWRITRGLDAILTEIHEQALGCSGETDT